MLVPLPLREPACLPLLSQWGKSIRNELQHPTDFLSSFLPSFLHYFGTYIIFCSPWMKTGQTARPGSWSWAHGKIITSTITRQSIFIANMVLYMHYLSLFSLLSSHLFSSSSLFYRIRWLWNVGQELLLSNAAGLDLFGRKIRTLYVISSKIKTAKCMNHIQTQRDNMACCFGRDWTYSLLTLRDNNDYEARKKKHLRQTKLGILSAEPGLS